MKSIRQDINRLLKSGISPKDIALARVVDAEGSTPREMGAAMAVTAEGEVSGSVSGGCVEGAVITEALEVLQTRQGRLTTFGYSDDEAFAVGLTCGGTLHIFIEPFEDWMGSDAKALYPALTAALDSNTPAALATQVRGPNPGAKLFLIAGGGNSKGAGNPGGAGGSTPKDTDNPSQTLGGLGNDELDRVILRDMSREMEVGRTGLLSYGKEGQRRETEVDIFIESFAPPPRLLIFGAVDFTAALCKVAKVMGYDVAVCDARSVFATPVRFPMADDIIVAWPDEVFKTLGGSLRRADSACILTHDPKFDIPAIMGALATDIGYIGVMGSRKTHENRLKKLKEAGASKKDIARLHAPIGLDIGARTPEETAVSILAEITASRSGRSGSSLRNSKGSIH